MKKILALILTISLLAAFALVFTSCDNDEKSYMAPPTINGVALADYALVYDEDGLDYNKRAVEYIKNLSHDRYGVELEVIDDSAEKRSHEIVVGETSRDISVSLDEDTQGFEFSILASDGSIALEGDYFVIAAAAYYFVETYVGDGEGRVDIPDTVTVIKEFAFKGNEAIKEIVIPDSVVEIGQGAFAECAALETVSISGAIMDLPDMLDEMDRGLEDDV